MSYRNNILFAVSFVVGMYCLVAFASWEYNPALWDFVNRTFAAVVCGLAIFGSFAYSAATSNRKDAYDEFMEKRESRKLPEPPYIPERPMVPPVKDKIPPPPPPGRRMKEGQMPPLPPPVRDRSK